MRPSEALVLNREKALRAAAACGATNVRVFGSVVRGEDREGSDVDLLVDMPPGTTLLDMVRLQREIEIALQVPVDLLTEGDLPKSARVRIVSEARPL